MDNVPRAETRNIQQGIGLVKLANGKGNAELREVSIESPGPGEVLVWVEAAAICGTDVHILGGRWKVSPPVVLGHEFSGTVQHVGEGVSLDWIGRRVASEVYRHTLGTCNACRAGYRNLCANRSTLGSHVNGAFAPAVVVPAANLHALPDSIEPIEAALIEPLACVASVLFAPTPIVVPGDKVLVLGAGAMGLLAAQAARAAGGRVLVLGRESSRRRLAIAELLGFPTAIASTDPSLSWTDSFDVVIECAGTASAVSTCLSSVKSRGRYVQLGLFDGPVPMDLNALCSKGVTISAISGATSLGFQHAIRLVEEGKVRLGPLITWSGAIEEWEAAVADMVDGGGVRSVLLPSQISLEAMLEV